MKRFYTLFVILFIFNCWFNNALAQNVRIPDANLATAIRKALGLSPGATITKQALSRLKTLNAARDQKDELPISNLSGLEHATELELLNLWQNRQISDLSPLADLTKLRSLSLGTNIISDLSPLAGLIQLSQLHLGGNQISDLSPLADLTKLRELGLGSNQISDLSPLVGLKQLNELYLDNNQISDLSPLAGLMQQAPLEFLGLGGNQISDLSPLAGLTRLKKLYLVNNRIQDVTPLAGLVNLEKLTLAGNPVQDVSPLADLIRLVEVDIDIPNQVIAGGVIPDRHLAIAVRAALHLTNIQPITKQAMQKLRTLIVPDYQVSSLKGLEHATFLEELVFNRCQISDLSPLENLTRLRWLSVGYGQISDLSPLTKLARLKRLNLQGNQIRDLSPLAKLTYLQSLWLVYNDISDLSPLADLTQLQHLGLYANEIRDVFPLSGLINLETLSLGNNPIGDTSPLSTLSKLRDVDIHIPPPPVVHLGTLSRPPIYWVDQSNGYLHRLIGTKMEYLVPDVRNVTGLAVDTRGEKIYWTEQTDRGVGLVKSGNLDGSNVKTLAILRSVPKDIVVDSVGRRLYWANSLGRIQRANLNGSQIQTLIRNLNSPRHIALDVAGGKLYWTEQPGFIRCANLDGSYVQNVVSRAGNLSGFAVSAADLYWTEQTGRQRGKIRHANLNSLRVKTLATLHSVPVSIAVDPAGRKLYWTNSRGKIQRVDFKGNRIQTLVTELKEPGRIALEAAPVATRVFAAPELVETPPDGTILFINYPNPFNPETWIPYQLAKPADVTITIYAASGQVVRRLALGYQRAGVYRTRSRAAYWDGKNAVGESMASGVYFYQLQTDTVSLLRKLVILK